MWDRTKVIKSTDTNVKKYVFEKNDAVAEAVLYKYPTYSARTVICCSTQSGCPVGCRFCGAGDRFIRSLTKCEIVSQVEHLLQETGEDPRAMGRLQIMFMSMGEPMLNYKNLEASIRKLHCSYPKAALLISTSGPRVDYAPLRKLSYEIPTVGLQFSVHESTNESRNKLIPFEAKLTLEEISKEGEEWLATTGRFPFFNYCAHDGNNTVEDATRIADVFKSDLWEATISVVCERDENVSAANARQRELAETFQAKLRNLGFSTRMFDPAGQDDIGGGCGQLWFVQKWMEDHSDKGKRSVGFSLPVVHTPLEE